MVITKVLGIILDGVFVMLRAEYIAFYFIYVVEFSIFGEIRRVVWKVKKFYRCCRSIEKWCFSINKLVIRFILFIWLIVRVSYLILKGFYFMKIFDIFDFEYFGWVRNVLYRF